MPATSSVLVPLPSTTSKVLSSRVASSSSWDATQISSILSGLISHLPPIAKTTEIASTSIVSSLTLTTTPMQVGDEEEVDTFVKELLQYVIKDFFFFLEHCINVILKGRSFTYVANLLDNYIDGIKSIGREENVAPYKVIMA